MKRAQCPPSLMTRLALSVPVVLAPLAGGPGSAKLAAAVSEAGGLGTLGSAYLTPQQLTRAAEIRQRTFRPFALNLFAPQPLAPVAPEHLQAALCELASIHAELGLAPPQLPQHLQEDFEAQFAAVQARPAALSFTFGRLSPAHLSALRRRGILSIGAATGLREVQALSSDGVDAICVQGVQAGGHRGSWLEDERQPTLALLRGAGVLRHSFFALQRSRNVSSLPRRAGPGRPNGLDPRVFGSLGTRLNQPPKPGSAAPLAHAAATEQGRSEFISLWAGEGVAQAREESAAQVLTRLAP